jgi:hypothetical protein
LSPSPRPRTLVPVSSWRPASRLWPRLVSMAWTRGVCRLIGLTCSMSGASPAVELSEPETLEERLARERPDVERPDVLESPEQIADVDATRAGRRGD